VRNFGRGWVRKGWLPCQGACTVWSHDTYLLLTGRAPAGTGVLHPSSLSGECSVLPTERYISNVSLLSCRHRDLVLSVNSQPIELATRSEALNVFGPSNTEVIGSNSTSGVGVCPQCLHCAGLCFPVKVSGLRQDLRAVHRGPTALSVSVARD
jgi:hypothetical protein